jgi:hypothetical protein
MSGWIVTYAKITIDKDDGISLLGVYFGGVAGDSDEADNIAKECVNTIRGGTIIPKIIMSNNANIIDALYAAEDKFEDMTSKMRDADDIINKTQKRK